MFFYQYFYSQIQFKACTTGETTKFIQDGKDILRNALSQRCPILW